MKLVIDVGIRGLAKMLNTSKSAVQRITSNKDWDTLGTLLGHLIDGKPLKISVLTDEEWDTFGTLLGHQTECVGQNKRPKALKHKVLEPKNGTPSQTDKNKEANKNKYIINNLFDDNNFDDNNMAKSIDERKDDFYKSLIPYVEKYGKQMVRDFYEYWSEYNRSETKMRCELQPTWQLAKRLATWNRKNKESSFGQSLDIGQAKNDSQTDEIVQKANF